jgi:hypothetical protein
VLDDLPGHRHLGDAAADLVRRAYSIEVTLPKLLELFERARGETRGLEAARPWPTAPQAPQATPPPTPFAG